MDAPDVLRHDRRGQRIRPLAHLAEPSLDQPASRADEPTINDTTVKRFHYDSHDQLRTHLVDWPPTTPFADSRHSVFDPYEYIGKSGLQSRIDPSSI